jgi:hypothetical protein
MIVNTKKIVLGSLMLGYVAIIATLGYHHTHQPQVEADTSYDYVPLDENFEKNQNDIIKWYAKIIYENDRKTNQ